MAEELQVGQCVRPAARKRPGVIDGQEAFRTARLTPGTIARHQLPHLRASSFPPKGPALGPDRLRDDPNLAAT